MRMAGGRTGRRRAIRTSSIRLWGRSDMGSARLRIEDTRQRGRRGARSARFDLPGIPEEAVEPPHLAPAGVEHVGRVAKLVALVGVHHQLGGNAERLEALPELVALRGRALAVSLAHQN